MVGLWAYRNLVFSMRKSGLMGFFDSQALSACIEYANWKTFALYIVLLFQLIYCSGGVQQKNTKQKIFREIIKEKNILILLSFHVLLNI